MPYYLPITLNFNTGLSLIAGMYVQLTYDQNTYMQGYIDSYDSNTGVLVFQPEKVVGTPDTYCGWVLTLTGNCCDGEAGAVIVLGTGCCSSVRCGVDNCASGIYSFAGGGRNNTASSNYSFVGGGCLNTSCANFATTVSGYYNTASGQYSFIGNGCCNTSLGNYSFIGSGANNCIDGENYGFIGGGKNNSFLSCDYSDPSCNNCLCHCSVIVGGSFNTIRSEIESTALNSCAAGNNFIGAGNSNCIENYICGCCSTAGWNAIVSGTGNRICSTCSGNYIEIIRNFVGSGRENVIVNSYNSSIVSGESNLICGNWSFIGAGCRNCVGTCSSAYITAFTSDFSSITSGEQNVVRARLSNIVGGCYNYIDGGGESVTEFNNIVGGCCNTISAYTNSSFIGGGQANTISSGCHGFIGGGSGNAVSGGCSFIGGGFCNISSASWSFVGGGYQNTASAYMTSVGGGYINSAIAYGATISGGYCGNACGQYSFVGGGRFNTVTGCASFAVGQCNTVSGNYSGAFGTGLSATCDCTSYFNNICNTGCTWSLCFVETSSQRFKENIQPINSALLNLNKLQGVCYNRIGSCSVEIGLIAEEVAKVYPQVVVYDGEGNPSGISYGRLSAILLESVKDLSEKFDTLQKEMNSLKKPN